MCKGNEVMSVELEDIYNKMIEEEYYKYHSVKPFKWSGKRIDKVNIVSGYPNNLRRIDDMISILSEIKSNGGEYIGVKVNDSDLSVFKKVELTDVYSRTNFFEMRLDDDDLFNKIYDKAEAKYKKLKAQEKKEKELALYKKLHEKYGKAK